MMDNKTAEILKDTMLHKQLVLQSCWEMANYFIEQGEEEKAIEIIRRGWTHDDSKFTKEEMECLILINDDYCSMRHAGCQLPEHMKEYLQLHYRNNTLPVPLFHHMDGKPGNEQLKFYHCP